MPTGEHRPVAQAAGPPDRLGDTVLIGGGRTRRRTLGPTPAVGQVVPHGQESGAGPLVADPDQQRGVPVAAGTVGEHHDTFRGTVGLVRHPGEVVKIHTAT
jgi:hypothetical protein